MSGKARDTDEVMTATEARKLLGIGKAKLAKLIASGALPTHKDPLDERVRLVRRSDVDALLSQSRKNAA
jgi:excisionase family DNA binding protein